LRADYTHSNQEGPAYKLGGLVASSLGVQNIGMQRGLTAAQAATATERANSVALAMGEINSLDFQDVLQNFGSKSDVTGQGTSLTAVVDLSDDIQFKSISAYRELERDLLGDQDGSRWAILSTQGYTTQEVFSQELQLVGDSFDDDLEWILGAFYSDETGTEGTLSDSLNSTSISNPSNTDGDVDNETKAVFAQGTYALTDSLSFTGGLRYTQDSKLLESHNSNAVGCTVPAVFRSGPACSGTFEDDWSATTYTASIDWKPLEDLLIYARTGKGYRSGGFNLRGSSTPATFAAFDPETVTDYELGLKTDVLDRRLRINAAAYYSEYEDIQRNVRMLINNVTTSLITNAAKGEVTGFELEVTAMPIDSLELRATTAYTDAGYKEWVDLTGDKSHLDFQQTPMWTYSLSAAYTLFQESGDLRMQLDWAWRDDVQFNPESVFDGRNGQPDLRGQKSFGLLNARIGKNFADSGIDVALFARNLLDEEYVAAALDQSATLGTVAQVAGEPRVIGAEIKKRF
ncbi:MAG: TonB-dependent receptor, partial [Spongiibacteraceae bacterium]